MRRSTLFATILFACSSTGCAGLSRQVADLSSQVRTLKQQSRQSRILLESLSNKVFILADRVDSNQVALKRRKGKVQLPDEKEDSGPRPTPSEPSSAPSSPAETGPPPPEPDRRPRLKVVKLRPTRSAAAGRARNDGAGSPGRRPVLRIVGRAPVPVRGGYMPPISMNERLPVMPLPSARSAAAAHSSQPAIDRYKAAYSLYQKGRYKEAGVAFSAFVKQFPRHDYSDNALFWLGQCLYQRALFQKALWIFRRVIKEYPNGNKTPDALLKMGLTYLRLGRKDQALKILAQVVQLYPGTRVARLAASTVKKLGKGR